MGDLIIKKLVGVISKISKKEELNYRRNVDFKIFSFERNVFRGATHPLDKPLTLMFEEDTEVNQFDDNNSHDNLFDNFKIENVHHIKCQ